MRLLALFFIGVAGFVATPRIGFRVAGAPPPRRASALPWLAAGLFTVAWLLPNPAWTHTTTFTQHAVGGGAACALVGAFIALNVGVRSWVLRIGLAYALSASLGVGVELAELGYDELYGTNLISDSAWDLLANTTGAALMAIAFEALLRLARDRNPAPA